MANKKRKEIDLGNDFDKAKEYPAVGDRLKDSTVVIAIDLKRNLALFAPEDTFGGNSDFDHQDGVIKKVNAQRLAGHKDWRRITDMEAAALAKAWNKVAPPALQGSAAPWFWGASAYNSGDVRVFRGGKAAWIPNFFRYLSRPVPVVRSGPARG